MDFITDQWFSKEGILLQMTLISVVSFDCYHWFWEYATNMQWVAETMNTVSIYSA